MRKLTALIGMSALAIAAAFTTIPPAAGASATECTDVLAPGTYQRVVVPAGAVCLSEGPIRINAGLWIRSGATFVLGSEESGWTTGTIGGGVHATDPASVQIHFATINGGIDIHGGSGPFGPPVRRHVERDRGQRDPRWRRRSTATTASGSASSGTTSAGTVRLSNNVLEDPDGNEYVTNTIHGSLQCSGNSPAPQVGDSQGLPNVVTGASRGSARTCSARSLRLTATRTERRRREARPRLGSRRGCSFILA